MDVRKGCCTCYVNSGLVADARWRMIKIELLSVSEVCIGA